MKVTNKITTTETQIEDSDADVFARVLVSQEGYGAIYTTYNTTNGIDYCSRLCLSTEVYSLKRVLVIQTSYRSKVHSIIGR